MCGKFIRVLGDIVEHGAQVFEIQQQQGERGIRAAGVTQRLREAIQLDAVLAELKQDDPASDLLGGPPAAAAAPAPFCVNATPEKRACFAQ